MKKRLYILSLLLIAFLLIGCETTGGGTPIDISACVFKDAEYTYDGTKKALVLENVPDGCSVSYKNNNQTNSGIYEVTAVISNGSSSESMTATLTINKAQGILEAEAVQNFLLGNKAVSATYTVNNDEQQIISNINNSFVRPGVYELELRLGESSNYLASEKVSVQVNVSSNEYGLILSNQTIIADGTEKSLAVSGTLPEGFSIEYVNNSHTTQGKYPVTAMIKNEEGNVVTTLRAIMTIDNPKNEEFEKYMDELLVLIFEGDEMGINFFFENASDYGIGQYEAKFSSANLEWSADDLLETQQLIDELNAFKSHELSYEEQDCLAYLVDYFTLDLGMTENMNYMSNSYLGSYLGAQANYPLELVEYKFRNERDITNYINILNTSEEAFESYFAFAKLQAEKGFGMTDYVINEVISQCNEFIKDTETHYLITTFNTKVDEVTFLTDAQKEEYKVQNKEALVNHLFKAYEYISAHLGELKGKAKNTGGLGNYGEDGTEYYRIKLGSTVGYYDIDLEEVKTYLDKKLSAVSRSVDKVLSNAQKDGMAIYNQFVGIVTDETNSNLFFNASDEEMIEFFKEKAKAYVPALKEMPDISVKQVPESLQDNFSPACYFVSPIDSTNKESIYLNGKYTEDRNYVFTTLAHEGYPGHLYQNVYTKSLDINDVRRVIRCQGFMEGWAVYMELKTYEMIEGWTTKAQKYAIEYFKLNDIYNGLLTARMDLGIHYEKWTKAETVEWINTFLGYTAYTTETITPLYNQLVEVATNSMMYYYTYCKLNDFRDLAMKELGGLYDEVEFNIVLLSSGALPLQMIEAKVNEYINQQKFVLGLYQ